MLKTFTVAPEQDSVRTAFRHGQRGTTFRLSLKRCLNALPEYVLRQDDIPIAIIRGKEGVCGGEHFAVIPLLPDDWEDRQIYRHNLDNVPYWDGEQRLRTLDVLLYNLSTGLRIHEALDDAVDAEDDEFFAGIPEVAYTGQQLGQPEDFPLPEPLPSAPPAKIYPWTFWYQSQGRTHQVILEATYEDAQRTWDALSTIFDMTSRRP